MGATHFSARPQIEFRKKSTEMKKDIDVLGIGNAIMDIIAPVPDAFLSSHDVERGSMTLIDEPRALSLNGALKSESDLREIAGGSAANTMVGIAEMGVKAGYVGKIGKDGVGKRLAQGYRDAGRCHREGLQGLPRRLQVEKLPVLGGLNRTRRR